MWFRGFHSGQIPTLKTRLIAVGKDDLTRASASAKKRGLGKVDRMILMCVDRKEAGCASSREMLESWKHLKRTLKETGLDGKHGVLRLKMQCCGLCKGGPILVVVPDMIWYGGCTPDVIDRIIQNHIVNGEPVDRYVIAAPDDVVLS